MSKHLTRRFPRREPACEANSKVNLPSEQGNGAYYGGKDEEGSIRKEANIRLKRLKLFDNWQNV